MRRSGSTPSPPRTSERTSCGSERTHVMVEFSGRNDRQIRLSVATSKGTGGRTSGMKDGTEQPFRRGQASTGDPSVVRDDIDLEYPAFASDEPQSLDKPHEECGVFGIFAPEE